MSEQVTISLVSPVYNEELKIESFIRSSVETLKSLGAEFEIVLVNDCSQDNTLSTLEKCVETYPQVKVINLHQNAGQHIATAIALRESSGEFIFMMDSDMQVAPEKMKDLFDHGKSNPNWDIISTYRNQRSKNLTRRIGSWVISWLLRKLTRSNLKDIGSTFKLIRRNALDRMISSDVLIQSLPILMMNLGFDIIELPIDYQLEQERKSHYRFKDLASAIILAVLNFTTGLNTLLFLISLGAGFSILGFCVIAGIIFWGMINQSILPTNYLLFFLFILLIGLIFLLLGIISFKLERINKNLQFRKSVNQHFDVIS